MKEKVYLQITSGRGPAECCRVVALVLERIVKQAQARGLKVEMIEREVGPVNHTLLSAVISLQGAACDEVVDEWEGTVQWIAQSPYRIYHKRKNWFVDVSIIPEMERVRRLRNMISVMKPCVLPDLADNTSTRQNRQYVRCIFLRE